MPASMDKNINSYLPPRQHEAFVAYYVKHKRLSEVSEQMGITESAVKKHLSKALKSIDLENAINIVSKHWCEMLRSSHGRERDLHEELDAAEKRIAILEAQVDYTVTLSRKR